MTARSEIVLGDCREVLAAMESNSVDSLVTDPPAGISFMGKKWDSYEGVSGFHDFLFGVLAECLRVMKPGAYGLVWSLPRTSHHTGMALERAGFEVRDCVYHLFGTGFPKSLDVSKALDRAAGAEREVIGIDPESKRRNKNSPKFDGVTMQHYAKMGDVPVTAPATDAARQWEGYGTALKPAAECWWLVRKPLEKKTVAEQVLATGTGALNIDGTRIGTKGEKLSISKSDPFHSLDGSQKWNPTSSGAIERDAHSKGRWPANVVLSHHPLCKQVGTETVAAPIINRFTDGMKPFGNGAGHAYESSGGGTEERTVYQCSEGCPVAGLDMQSGITKSAIGRPNTQKSNGATVNFNGRAFSTPGVNQHGDAGGASRFFQNFEPDCDVPFIYANKASQADRNSGIESGEKNTHPTVKGKALMAYLVRLVTPYGGVVLDPFAGSGSTLTAAITQGFSCVGIEKEAEYVEIAKVRMAHAAVEREVLAKKFKSNSSSDLFYESLKKLISAEEREGK